MDEFKNITYSSGILIEHLVNEKIKYRLTYDIKRKPFIALAGYEFIYKNIIQILLFLLFHQKSQKRKRKRKRKTKLKY